MSQIYLIPAYRGLVHDAPYPRRTAGTCRCSIPVAAGLKPDAYGDTGIPASYLVDHNRWQSLTLFLDDGCVEVDTNAIERAIRPIALGRKNALFAGSDGAPGVGRSSPR
jgi:hypothetical protein